MGELGYSGKIEWWILVGLIVIWDVLKQSTVHTYIFNSVRLIVIWDVLKRLIHLHSVIIQD